MRIAKIITSIAGRARALESIWSVGASSTGLTRIGIARIERNNASASITADLTTLRPEPVADVTWTTLARHVRTRNCCNKTANKS